MLRKYRFNKICNKIRAIKIQGATNIAKAALKAYSLFPGEETKKSLTPRWSRRYFNGEYKFFFVYNKERELEILYPSRTYSLF